MTAKRIEYVELAALIGMHPASVSRLRNIRYIGDSPTGKRDKRYMRTVEGKTLNSLCKALDCKPGDLQNYVPD